MSQENQITLRGYLTAEPKFYQKTPQATPVTEIRVGCTPRRLNRETGEWYDLPTSYYRVKAWRRLAINTASSLHKGDQVLIRGHFYMSTWVDNQQRPRSTLEIEADTIGHDLAHGWSHYMRGTRPSGNGAAVNSGEMARQDTGTTDAGTAADDEYIAALEATGTDEFEEAEPSTVEQAQPPEQGQDEAVDAAWRPGFTGDSQPDTPAEWGAHGADSLEREGSAVERETVPF
jgi:single-strand DNA-binding protein